MNSLLNTLKQGTDFGKFHRKENLFSFILKCLFYIIPAVLLGNSTDTTIQILKKEKIFGKNNLHYILLQTFINITTLYIILFLLYAYSSEFQVTLEGGFFSVLYFGMQTEYINMMKEYINNGN
jgi:hypothetical protein